MKKYYLAALTGSLLLLSACAPQQNSLYHWGDYDDIVYSHYNDEGNYSKQEENLQKIISQAQKTGKAIAPGIYGHLGLVLLKQGRQEEANKAFQEEQRLHPESQTFMQYLQRKK